MSRPPAKRMRRGPNQYRSFGSLRYRLIGLLRSYAHLRRECKPSEARDCATRIADVAEQLVTKVERQFPNLHEHARQLRVLCANFDGLDAPVLQSTAGITVAQRRARDGNLYTRQFQNYDGRDNSKRFWDEAGATEHGATTVHAVATEHDVASRARPVDAPPSERDDDDELFNALKALVTENSAGENYFDMTKAGHGGERKDEELFTAMKRLTRDCNAAEKRAQIHAAEHLNIYLASSAK